MLGKLVVGVLLFTTIFIFYLFFNLFAIANMNLTRMCTVYVLKGSHMFCFCFCFFSCILQILVACS